MVTNYKTLGFKLGTPLPFWIFKSVNPDPLRIRDDALKIFESGSEFYAILNVKILDR
jgi:hypothetical protein